MYNIDQVVHSKGTHYSPPKKIARGGGISI